jgi:ferredoxin-NADP reductase
VHGPEQPPIIRSYSLSGAAGADGYRISVKREPDGAGSGFIHERLRVGDTLEAAAPRGSFTLRPGDRPVVLVSAGVGATPVLAMLHALAVAHTRREVWWVHGARNRRELAFAAEVDQLLEALPDAHRIVSFSRPDAGCGVGSGFDAVGRITGETLASASIPIDADYYLCGPAAFMDSLSAALTARGTLPERVATEVFGSPAVITVPGLNRGAVAPHQPDGAPGSGPPVTFSRSDLSVSWDSSHGNLLELAEACDVPVSFGCRNGVCHYCETGLLDGEVSYGTEPLERPGEDRVLLCCAQPAGPVVLEL